MQRRFPRPQKEVLCVSKNKTAKEKRPWHILIWLILYLVNLLAALAFQYFFIHTYSAPLTAESLGSISYFNGCEILDISGEGVPDNSLIGKSSPDWILYKNQAGETHAVRIEWNLYMPRFRIEKNSNTLIPNEESYTFSMRDFLGKNEVTVENQEAIVQLKWSGLFRQQGYIQGIHMLTALGLLLLESWIYLRIQKKQNA